jgi:hypothetical protein
MKALDIPKLQFPETYPDLVEVSSLIEQHGTKTNINVVNWKEFTYKPEVFFFSTYTPNEIMLKYCVMEDHILAQHTSINSPVYEDSCVEFFISSGNSFYYNFEFNCIGTSSAGYGERREGRVLIDSKKVSTIRTYSTLGDKPIASRKIDNPWELTVAIPFSIFSEC